MATVDRRGNIVDSVDLAIKAPCRAATTAAITLAGLQTIDGVALAEGDRVLVKDQADQTTNGIYVASTGNWTRATDADSNEDWTGGTLVAVVSGGGQIFEQLTPGPITLGTTAMVFARGGSSQDFNVIAFGAKGDGSTNDLAAFQAALAAAIASGRGGVVSMLGGRTYVIEDDSADAITFNIGTPNIYFNLNGATLDLRSTAANKTFFAWNGSTGTAFTLTADVAKSANDFFVTPAPSVMANGEFVTFKGKDSNNNFHFWAGRVQATASDNFVVDGTIPFALPTANNATNQVLRANSYLQYGGMYGGTLIGTNCSGVTNLVGVQANFVRNFIFDRLYFKNFSGASPTTSNTSALLMTGGIENRVGDIITEHCGSAGLDAIEITEQCYMAAGPWRGIGNSGFGPAPYTCSDSFVAGIVQTGTEFGRGVKLFQNVRVGFGPLVVNGSALTGVAFENSNNDCTVASIDVSDCVFRGGTPGDNYGVVFDGTGSTGNVVGSVHSTGNTDYDIIVADPGNVIGHGVVSSFAKVRLDFPATTSLGPIYSTGDGYSRSYVPGSMIVGNPTGGDLGNGWINVAAGVAVNGTPILGYSAGNGLTLSGHTFSIDTSITVDKTTAQVLTNKTLTAPVMTAPTLGVAAGTSLALGGATIGSNALAVIGTSLFNDNLTLTKNQNAQTQLSITNTNSNNAAQLNFNMRGPGSATVNWTINYNSGSQYMQFASSSLPGGMFYDFVSHTFRTQGGGTTFATFDTTGLNLAMALGVGTAPLSSAFEAIAAGTTAKSQINFGASTAPTSPNNGDFWFDGTNFKARVGGTTKTFTLT